MAAWGTGLYQDDIAEDVRNYYKEQLRSGKQGREITSTLIEGYAAELSDEDDAPVFWLALADTQWNLGRLEEFVKEEALKHIRDGRDLRRWEAESPKEAKARAGVHAKIAEKLLSPQPAEKKISEYRLYKCEWALGDVFAYRLESDLAREQGLYGRYFLFQKVDEGIWHPGHVVPIVQVKLTNDYRLPTSTEEFDCLEYVQVSSRRFNLAEQEFRPKEKKPTEEGYWEEVEVRKAGLAFDEYGFLPVFRIRLANTSKRVIPSKLVFVGNFPRTKSPDKEFIPQNKVELP